MNPRYQGARRYADYFINHQIQILADCFKTAPDQVTISDLHQDCNEATDFIINTVNGKITIGARMRRQNHMRYVDQFTLRLSGIPNEFQKIKKGCGDFILYGFGSFDQSELTTWRLIDLNVFRRFHFLTTPDIRQTPDCHFASYRFDEFPASLVVASSLQNGKTMVTYAA